MFVTKKKYKKSMNAMMAVAGTGVATGVTGVTLATIALVKESNYKKKTDESIQNIEKHLASVENSCTKACKVLVPVQQAMFENGMLKRT